MWVDISAEYSFLMFNLLFNDTVLNKMKAYWLATIVNGYLVLISKHTIWHIHALGYEVFLVRILKTKINTASIIKSASLVNINISLHGLWEFFCDISF